jgi:hypothetical protein
MWYWWILGTLLGGFAVAILWGKFVHFGSGEDDGDEYPWWDNEDWGDKS